MTNPFRGTYTALITPFRNGQVDFEALERHVAHQIEAGVDGLVPCGTTGEAPTLTADEYQQIIACVVRIANRRVPVVAGAGTNCTTTTIARCHVAVEAGADGLLVVAPYYNKPPQAGLFEHFSAVASEIKQPIVLYNIPGRSGVEIARNTVQRLCESHENIVAIKHATGSVAGAAELLAACSIELLSGDDPLTWPLMSLGAVGVVSALSNLTPRAVKRVTQAALARDFTSAQAAHHQLYPFAQALLSLDTNPLPVKTAMAAKGWCAEEFRLPLCPLGATARSRLINLVNATDLD